MSRVSAGDVVSVGMVCLDFSTFVDTYPLEDTKNIARKTIIAGGGNAANSAVAFSRLSRGMERSGSFVLITKVGDDAPGSHCMAELADAGVDTRLCVRSATHATASSTIIVTANGHRTIIHSPGVNADDPLRPDEIDLSVLGNAVLVHFDGRHAAAALVVAAEARRRGIPILVEAERVRPGLWPLLEAADYAIFSEYGPVQLAAEIGAPADASDDPLLAARHVIAERMPHVRVVIVTRGAAGSVAFERVAPDIDASKGELCAASPLPVETRHEHGWAVHTCGVWPIERVVDTTGAGDAFIGAALFALSHRLPIEKVLPFASCVAALNCTGEGPRGGMPMWAQMPRCFDGWFEHI